VTAAPRVILDDRLLVEELLVGSGDKVERHTTAYWYYRACRAAIRSLLVLPDTIGLPDPRAIVPVMAELSERHPRLNLLNLEAAAAGIVLDATVLLSVEATHGVLPGILDAETVRWRTVTID
jgi:hypothetical protein